MIVIIVTYIVLLMFLLDDVTTYVLFAKGLGALETNIIYLYLGLAGMIVLSILAYLFIIFTFRWLVKTYRKVYSKRYPYYKLYDIFVFIFCLGIVVMATNKIEIGAENIHLMLTYHEPDKKVQIQKTIQEVQEIKAQDEKVYKEVMLEAYKPGIVYGITYFEMIYKCILAYLLMRVSYKVVPYDMA